MAENDSTVDHTTPKELADVQAVLDRIMNNGDEQTKRLIFNRVICQMADALPKPEFTLVKEPEPTAAIRTQNLRDADDKLSEAKFMAEFIQSISLSVPHDGSLHLDGGQVTGFYLAMKNTIDRITEAQALIDDARKEPEALQA